MYIYIYIYMHRNRDAKTTILDTSAIMQTEYALSIFPKIDKIIWRACIALTCMSTLRQVCEYLCIDILYKYIFI
jgi:hypothetical protein